MRDYLYVGSGPCSEDCAQLGSDNYREQSRRELRAFIGQLRRQFGNEPDGARLAIKAEQHDFGTYHEVVCRYDTNNEAAVDYAFRCEGDAWTKWDKISRTELGLVS